MVQPVATVPALWRFSSSLCSSSIFSSHNDVQGEVVVFVAGRPVVVGTFVYRGGQMVMLARRYNRSNLLEAAKKTLRCSGPMLLTWSTRFSK